jgi:hypothetical protein
MRGLDEGSAGDHLGVLDHLGDIVDGAHRDALGEEQRLPLLVRAGEEDFLEPGDQGVAVSRPVRVGAIAWIVGQLRAADRGAEHLPELLAAHRQGEVAALGAEGLIRQQRLVRGAHRERQLAVGEVAADHAAEERELALQHRDVDGLAAAGPLLHAQREHDAERGVHARGHVGDGDPAADAVPVRLPGGADHPALGLEDQVERGAVAVRAVLAEAGDRAVDDPGIPLARGLVAQAEPGQGADPVVL